MNTKKNILLIIFIYLFNFELQPASASPSKKSAPSLKGKTQPKAKKQKTSDSDSDDELLQQAVKRADIARQEIHQKQIQEEAILSALQQKRKAKSLTEQESLKLLKTEYQNLPSIAHNKLITDLCNPNITLEDFKKKFESFIVQYNIDSLIIINPHQPRSQQTLLLWSSEHIRPDIVRFLLQKGANPNIGGLNSSKQLYTPLYRLIELLHTSDYHEQQEALLDIINQLTSQPNVELNIGMAGPNDCYDTLLGLAIHYTNKNLTNFLIAKGASINFRGVGFKDKTILYLSPLYNAIENYTIGTASYRMNALQAELHKTYDQKALNDLLDIIKILLQKPDIDLTNGSQTKHSFDPLWVPVIHNANTEILPLLDNPIIFNQLLKNNNNKVSILYYAMSIFYTTQHSDPLKNNLQKNVMYLLNNPNVNINLGDENPISLTIQATDTLLLKTLMNKNANLNSITLHTQETMPMLALRKFIQYNLSMQSEPHPDDTFEKLLTSSAMFFEVLNDPNFIDIYHENIQCLNILTFALIWTPYNKIIINTILAKGADPLVKMSDGKNTYEKLQEKLNNQDYSTVLDILRSLKVIVPEQYAQAPKITISPEPTTEPRTETPEAQLPTITTPTKTALKKEKQAQKQAPKEQETASITPIVNTQPTSTSRKQKTPELLTIDTIKESGGITIEMRQAGLELIHNNLATTPIDQTLLASNLILKEYHNLGNVLVSWSHILLPQIHLTYSMTTKLFTPTFTGAHTKAAIENLKAAGYISIQSETQWENECIEYQLKNLFNGSTFFKTIFPTNWDYKKIITAVKTAKLQQKKQESVGTSINLYLQYDNVLMKAIIVKDLSSTGYSMITVYPVESIDDSSLK